MEYISIFFQYVGQYLKTRLTYRADMIVEIFSDLLFQAVNLVFILVVFGHTNLLAGWSKDEMIFIYGFFLVPFSIFASFFNIWDFTDRYIVKGEMDRILTRPVHSLFQIVLERMELESLFGVVTGLVVMFYAGDKLGLEISWYDPFIFILLVIGGALVYAGIFIALATIGFWSDSRTDIMPMMYNIGNYGRYPVDIYNKVIKYVLTWILPFAFVGVYPSSYFLEREEWYTYAFLTPVVGIVFFLIAVTLWNVGVTKYRGAGN
ncbi:MAG: ABC transporter permease [Bacillota bacterium]|mgnify:CR=1 FL=1|jgi:ABC-2 type transport system permease protein|uniref:ABC-2 family transporter protein n=1 Tax=Fictibacillus norfolkensis TaxID=2762233 RepID=A0ABR8SSM7_9BACL|nr:MULTISPECIES: ABC-2 family transporter protein [Fictibacillus]MBD7966405.1 ABC-2 family transporter protein [Fictibacillus norfolkensis]MBH0162913.1 ABC-2 family transporter protein [Fictibacillus sp. 26RED30]MBH0171422.1 ABC-2 family transporter protein [Fictibacillus sp. 18YEL24]MBH0175052.1 ABC-2 family transporter protein [Fictibacillus sp. 23RED33]